MVSRRNNSNGPQSQKRRGIAQLPFLSRRIRKNDGGTNNALTTLRGLRRFSLRGNKTQPLLQSPVEEASAELLKSGPLETPTGALKGGTATSENTTKRSMPSVLKDLRLLSPIEEQDSEEDTVVSKPHK
mmetsp:Transcript_4901/g.8077  ORF Transcript_4901/g.8077 Transcript_4901/m.8077 type:complete len:129 (-) Transcript_4901:274-660(-)|eukprot:CAMPEP_0119003154 /NCGR_PEP_ID=MMETSP1176-20130426/389_1 /TAXON_ID=265551 /ORGANISM="Synedropsis recta cf, Strain CCMP1620" /LENGTH=128 /DNA_ID=CAMNT_0006954727 /DNA_START=137 /DNA_END=523 /DNA_ORIENTATION=+